MDFINYIKNDTLIICDKIYKNRLLEELNKTSNLFNINFMTMDELIKKYYFYYDEKTIYYLIDKYKIKYEIAKVYLDNLYFIDDKKYNSDKLNKLVRLKKELMDQNLLKIDLLFEEYLQNKDVIVYNYDLNKFQIDLLEKISIISNVKIINKQYSNYNHKIYEFNTLDEEVEYVAYKISELITKGIDINNIKLANITEEYIPVIKRIFGFYNLPLNINSNTSIYSTKIVKDFINNYNDNIEVAVEAISKYKDNEIYNLIIDICNKYRWCDNYNDIKELFIYDLKHTNSPMTKYDKAIEVIDYKDNDIRDEYVFLLNFNLGSIPKVYKDEDYITDSLKEDLLLENTVEKNIKEKEIVKKSIGHIKNLFITYKLKSPTNVFYPSNLVDLYEVEKDKINQYISYSNLSNKLKLSNSLDKLVKYGSKDPYLSLLYNNYEIPYMSYNNNYNKIDTELLKDYLHGNLNLSYSKLEDYNECAFKYYLSNILKLNIYEDNFSTVIGTVFHHILEIGLKKEIDINEELDLFLKEEYKDRVFTNKEIFFLNKIKKDMIFVLDTIKKQMNNCKFDKILTEQKVVVNKERNLTVTFTGIIDKLLYKEDNNQTLVAIIDYKTGNPDIELGYLPEGLHLQLPIYLYLASNMKFKNIKFAGIYLQKVMPGIDKIDFKGKVNKEAKLKLEGYSTTDENVLSQFDLSYKDSEVIKSMKVKQDGNFAAYAKVLAESDLNKLVLLADEQIDKCIDNIIDANFDINPKQEEKDKSITACKYCKYRDICFRKPKDVIKIHPDVELSYLGGEDND